MDTNNRFFSNVFAVFLSLIVITACSPDSAAQTFKGSQADERSMEELSAIESDVAISPEVAADTPAPTMTLTSTSTMTLTPTSTITHTATSTATVTPIPTYVVLRAKVLEQANCRYGPGVAYLYKYGLFPGSNIEVIGRNELGTFAYIQAIGGNNPCWVSASVLDIKGDIMHTAPTVSVLPYTQYYGPPACVHAKREGEVVIVSWCAVNMTEDKYRGYLIEAWLCQDGSLVFTPVRSDEAILNLVDEPGCSEPSGGRLYTAEKHGYSQWITIPWPSFDATSQPDSTEGTP